MNFGVDEIANPRLSSVRMKRVPRRSTRLARSSAAATASSGA
jgi:hypothetical protein